MWLYKCILRSVFRRNPIFLMQCRAQMYPREAKAPYERMKGDRRCMYLFCCFWFGMTDLKKKAEGGDLVSVPFPAFHQGAGSMQHPDTPSLLVRSKLQKMEQRVSAARWLKALCLKLLSGSQAMGRGRRSVFPTKISSSQQRSWGVTKQDCRDQ